jgi:hypothetical protein
MAAGRKMDAMFLCGSALSPVLSDAGMQQLPLRSTHFPYGQCVVKHSNGKFYNFYGGPDQSHIAARTWGQLQVRLHLSESASALLTYKFWQCFECASDDNFRPFGFHGSLRAHLQCNFCHCSFICRALSCSFCVHALFARVVC